MADGPHHVRLHFDDAPGLQDRIRNISAAVRVGGTLWLGSDEGTAIQRLVRKGDDDFHQAGSFDLAEFFELPDGRGDEIDIEALDFDDDWLWVLGSHCATRGKPEKADEGDVEEAFERLGRVRQRPNRRVLARLPLGPDERGLPTVFTKRTGRHAACLKMKRADNALSKVMRDDEVLAPFLELPAKDNGFDIEGVAAAGNRLFLGLRGPVIAGLAMMLEIRVKEKKSGELKLRKSGPDGRRYCRHALDLHGLGVRSLHREGDDLLVLAGPAMKLSGRMAIFRWPDAFGGEGDGIVPAERLQHVMDLPYGEGVDHAEGLAFLPGDDGEVEMLVVHDSPAPHRVSGRTIKADLYRLDADVLRGEGSVKRPRRGRPRLAAQR